MRWLSRPLAVAAFVLLLPAPALADDHFAAVFAAETVPFRSTHTHTFVVVVRVPTAAVNGLPAPVEMHHISWFPASLQLRGLTAHPERGVNLGPAETFVRCRLNGMRVSAWGPYRIAPELFELMKAQRAYLESGRVLYKPTDNVYHPDVAANCYHAIWRPIAPCRKHSGPFNCGDASGAMTVRLFSPWLICPWETHDWVLGLIVPPGEMVMRRAFDDRPRRLDAIRSARGR
jgi:hypothetical protein